MHSTSTEGVDVFWEIESEELELGDVMYLLELPLSSLICGVCGESPDPTAGPSGIDVTSSR